jgi:hypothetical protein
MNPNLDSETKKPARTKHWYAPAEVRDVKSCPFCEGAAEVIHERHLDMDYLQRETFHVRCRGYRCKVKPGVSKSTLSQALDAWNGRTPSHD